MENKRQHKRIYANYPVDLIIDSQITIQGKLKNLSVKGAFIIVKSSVSMQVHDEFGLSIRYDKDETKTISGTVCITRIFPGEGVAVYFTKMEEESVERLKKLVEE